MLTLLTCLTTALTNPIALFGGLGAVLLLALHHYSGVKILKITSEEDATKSWAVGSILWLVSWIAYLTVAMYLGWIPLLPSL